MSNSVFVKIMENVTNHRDIKLLTIDQRRRYFVSEPNYYRTKWFSESLFGNEMNEIKVKMNKTIDLGLKILEISKTVICQFFYNYIKPKYQGKSNLCYMDTDSFIINTKIQEFYKSCLKKV